MFLYSYKHYIGKGWNAMIASLIDRFKLMRSIFTTRFITNRKIKIGKSTACLRRDYYFCHYLQVLLFKLQKLYFSS